MSTDDRFSSTGDESRIKKGIHLTSSQELRALCIASNFSLEHDVTEIVRYFGESLADTSEAASHGMEKMQ